jgi:hypothetical protein
MIRWPEYTGNTESALFERSMDCGLIYLPIYLFEKSMDKEQWTPPWIFESMCRIFELDFRFTP